MRDFEVIVDCGIVAYALGELDRFLATLINRPMAAATCGFDDCFIQGSAMVVTHGNGLAPIATCFAIGAASCDGLADGGYFPRWI